MSPHTARRGERRNERTSVRAGARVSGGGNTTHTSACTHSVCLSPPRLSLLLRNRTCDGTLHRNDVCFFHEQITYYRAQPPQLVLCKVVSIPKLRYPAIHVCVVCSHRLLRLLQFFIREKKTITGVGRRPAAGSKPSPSRRAARHSCGKTAQTRCGKKSVRESTPLRKRRSDSFGCFCKNK